MNFSVPKGILSGDEQDKIFYNHRWQESNINEKYFPTTRRYISILGLTYFLIIIVGVLGLCAIVRSSPYDISIHLPDALMLLCEHSYDLNLIQVSVVSNENEIDYLVF
jgi:hypothetical protein